VSESSRLRGLWSAKGGHVATLGRLGRRKIDTTVETELIQCMQYAHRCICPVRRRSSAALRAGGARGAAAPEHAVLGAHNRWEWKIFMCCYRSARGRIWHSTRASTIALMRPCVGVRFSDAAIVTVSSRVTDQMKRPHRLAGDRASICSGDCETSRPMSGGRWTVRRCADSWWDGCTSKCG